MKYVIGVAEEMLCGGAGERRELIPVFKRMYEEMNAATNRGVPELKWLNAMQYMIVCRFLATAVVEHRLAEDEAMALAPAFARDLAKAAYRL